MSDFSSLAIGDSWHDPDCQIHVVGIKYHKSRG
jgi:hypothetical protein